MVEPKKHVDTISMPTWNALTYEERDKIREILQMKRTGKTEVFTGFGGNKLISDGTTYDDMAAVINVDNLQTILKSKEDNIYKLFESLKIYVNRKFEKPNKATDATELS